MSRQIIRKEFQCLLYSEGGKDKKFLYALTELSQFKYHTSRWTSPQFGHASGSSPRTIIDGCRRTIKGGEYHLILCFIDLDQLKKNYAKTWLKEKEKLERESLNDRIKIIWQINNLEDEFKQVLGQNFGKSKLNKFARENVRKFINSEYWKKILRAFKDEENRQDKL